MQCFCVNVRERATEFGFMPSLQLYLLDGKEPRPLVIIVPGGGYEFVCVEEDGDKTALQYNAAGFHAAVLNYCVEPHHFPEPQLDLALSIKLLREHATEWGIHKDRIAVCGFSAGAHLCASLSTLWNHEKLFEVEDIRTELHKPNACILFSAILTTRLGHCKAFLLDHAGADTPENLELVACDKQVNPGTPPTFLYSTFEDKLTNVENVLYYGEALSKNNVPFEMHVFPKGGHCAPWCDSVTWAKPPAGRNYKPIKLSIDWLVELFQL